MYHGNPIQWCFYGFLRFFINFYVIWGSFSNIEFYWQKSGNGTSLIKMFQTKHLMEVMNILHDLIESRLNDASYVTIILDCWSDGANSHVLGTLKTA